jgi:hypothetical protein
MKKELKDCQVGDYIKITKVRSIQEHLYTTEKSYEVVGINKSLTIGQSNTGNEEVQGSWNYGSLQIIADDNTKRNIRLNNKFWIPSKEDVMPISSEFVYNLLLSLDDFEKNGYANATFDRLISEKELKLIQLLGFTHKKVFSPNQFDYKPDENNLKNYVSSIRKCEDE